MPISFPAIDEPWARMSRERAEKIERVVEAVETLIADGVYAFTVRMVANLCRGRNSYYDPTFSTIERIVRDMAATGVIAILRKGAPGKATVFGVPTSEHQDIADPVTTDEGWCHG